MNENEKWRRVAEVIENCLECGYELANLSQELSVDDVSKIPQTVEAFADILLAFTKLLNATDKNALMRAADEKFPAGAN